MSRPVDIDIRGVASGGAGVGDLPDGRVVFVPRTAPGDRARIRIEKSRPRWAVGSLVRLLEPGPDRVEAACPLYAECGGCHLQHLVYERQLEWKGRFVADALHRIGCVDPVETPDVCPSPRREHYRNRVTYTLRRLRGGRVVAGFHGLARPAHVVEVHGECLLPDEALGEAWMSLRSAWGEGARNLPDGGRLQLTLRLANGGVELAVSGGADGWDATELARAVPQLSAIWQLSADDGGEPRLLAGSSGPGGGAAFAQVNPQAAALLRSHVLDVASELAKALREQGDGAAALRAVDAYCGTGEYGRGLAEAGWSVHGIEVDAHSVEAAGADAPRGFDVVRGRVEDVLDGVLPADLLIVNPPRSGLSPDIPPLILTGQPPVLIYVSCDPGTLARDVRALSDRYELSATRSFDFFPQTAHVETVAVLGLRP